MIPQQKKTGIDLFRMFSAGDLQSIIKIYDKYTNLFGNASPSFPAESVISSLNNISTDAILISITLTDHIQTTRNLIRKIRTKFPSLTIFVGGIALNDPNKTSDFNATNVYFIRNMVLADAI